MDKVRKSNKIMCKKCGQIKYNCEKILNIYILLRKNSQIKYTILHKFYTINLLKITDIKYKLIKFSI